MYPLYPLDFAYCIWWAAMRYAEGTRCRSAVFLGEIAMHINLFMPRAVHHIQKSVNEAYKFIGNYIYYRKCFNSHKTAWSMAKRTL